MKDAPPVSSFNDSPFAFRKERAFFCCPDHHPSRDGDCRHVRNPGAHDARAAGVFIAPGPRRHARRSFLSRSKPTTSRRLAAARSHFPHNLTSQLTSFQGTTRAETRRARASTRNRLASRASRVSGAPALAIAFLVSVARRKFHPRTRHRVVRRLTRARLPTPSNPPQMASKDGSTFFFTSESVNEGHPDKLADQVRDRALVDSGALATRTVAFSPDGIAKSSRGDAEVSRPPRASRRVSDVPLTRLPPHTSPQISDGVLDACLAQDPDSKVRLRPRKRSPVESAKTRASETFFATRATRAETRVVERARPRFHRAMKRPRQSNAPSTATRRGRLARLDPIGRTRERAGRTRRAADTSDEQRRTAARRPRLTVSSVS